MSQQIIQLREPITFVEKDDKHGLHGHVSVYRRNKKTGEVSLWEESDNIIPISGYQWILMKMFGLHLDSDHKTSSTGYDNMTQDTTVAIPDLNNSMNIGTNPDNYTKMTVDISSHHIVQGFMVGNGGAGEDQMTAKNTDYSFVKLRNPIPFQQTSGATPLSGADRGKYCGEYRASSGVHSYYIKRFNSRPRIVHSWWKDGQGWDYIDPVTQSDLGPDASSGAGKTTRIESYAECEMVLTDTDCASFFSHDGNTQTPAINEIGLVAFDTPGTGTRNKLEDLYTGKIQKIIDIVFMKDTSRSPEMTSTMKSLAGEACTELLSIFPNQSWPSGSDGVKIGNLYTVLLSIKNDATPQFESYRTDLESTDCIKVTAYYDRDGNYRMETDQYLEIIASDAFDSLTVDEAQRVKLITYYTFKPIPVQSSWEILIKYRIYAN